MISALLMLHGTGMVASDENIAVVARIRKRKLLSRIGNDSVAFLPDIDVEPESLSSSIDHRRH